MTATLFARADACGRLPDIVAEAESWAAAQVMAEGGFGVALLPSGIATEGRSNAAVFRIEANPLSLECAVATRSSDSDDPLLTDLSMLLSDAVTAH